MCPALVIHGLRYLTKERLGEVQEQTMRCFQLVHVCHELACMICGEPFGVLYLNHYLAVDEEIALSWRR